MLSERYCRQINLIGEENQLKLARASILVIGAGGVGSPVLLYLAAGGVGNLGFIDHDFVTLSNLHRQILYTEQDLYKAKSEVAFHKLKALNSEISLVEHHSKLTLENASSLFSNYDLIIDGSDNFKTRYLVNDICSQLMKPFISAAIYQKTIQIIFFNIQQGCYRCAFPVPPPPFLINNCSVAGVLGPTAGLAGSIAASLALKYFINPADIDAKKIISLDSDSFKTEHFSFSRNENCPACQYKKLTWPTESFGVEFDKIELSKFKIVDLREHHENRETRLTTNDYHIPFTEILELPDHIPQGALLLYCQSGVRSEYAAYFLRKNGYQSFSLEPDLF